MNWDECDRLWRERHLPASLTALSELLVAHCDTAPEYSGLWRLSRLYHFCGMMADEEQRTQRARQQFADGAEVGRRAVRADWTGVEGNFWYGVNAIEAARRNGMLAAAMTLPRASRHIERAMSIDETYHFAGPVRVWGRIMHFKPLFLGGTIDRAIDIYHRALQIDDRNSTTLLYYAEALIVDQQWRNARRVLRRILDAPDDPEWLWEQARDRRRANVLLEQLEKV
jgi:tetratricopeptide (TPR) repeat protein